MACSLYFERPNINCPFLGDVDVISCCSNILYLSSTTPVRQAGRRLSHGLRLEKPMSPLHSFDGLTVSLQRLYTITQHAVLVGEGPLTRTLRRLRSTRPTQRRYVQEPTGHFSCLLMLFMEPASSEVDGTHCNFLFLRGL